MVTESKVVIINPEGKMLPLGRINSLDLHGKLIIEYLKRTYPNIEAFQTLGYDTYLPILFYFCAKTNNALLINTSEKSRKLSCTLVLPDNYKMKLEEIKTLLSIFKDYEYIIEAYPYSDNGWPKFKKEIENVNFKKVMALLDSNLEDDHNTEKKLLM